MNTRSENIMIVNCTITYNFISNPLADNQAGYHGAGLYLHSPHGNDISLELVSSVVNGNYHPTGGGGKVLTDIDRKSTRLNSSHVAISYAVLCLKKKNQHYN